MWTLLTALQSCLIWTIPAAMLAGIVYVTMCLKASTITTNLGMLLTSLLPLALLYVINFFIGTRVGKLFFHLEKPSP